jgi:hypothetical protein
LQAVIKKCKWIVLVERFTAGETVALVTSRRAGAAIWVTGTAAVPGGHPVGDTTGVFADVAGVGVTPLALRAVTVTRSVCPTSAAPTL